MARILVIEDDGAIRRAVRDALRFAGHHVDEASDGDDGWRRARLGTVDLVLLDLVLPGMQGRDLLGRVREVHPTLPVILLTAVGSEESRVDGLRSGADDYVVKPFSVRELLARVDAVLRRSPGRPTDRPTVMLAGGRIADLARREIRFADGSRHGLGTRDAAILRYLAIHRDRAVSREELLAAVWRVDTGGAMGSGGTRTVDMHMARLREKLRDAADRPQVLLTVRGAGYRLGDTP